MATCEIILQSDLILSISRSNYTKLLLFCAVKSLKNKMVSVRAVSKQQKALVLRQIISYF